MKKIVLTIAAVVVSAMPNAAHAWNVPLPAAPIEWHLGEPCPNRPTRGCTMDVRPIPIYMPRDQVTNQNVWHELGHAFDYSVMTDANRDTWRSIMHERRPWRTSPNSPHERFAESYALCQLGTRGAFRGYDFWPTRRQLRAICLLIRHASR